MNSNTTKATVLALAVCAVGSAAYYNWDTLVELAELVMYDSKKAEALLKLRKVRTVLKSFRQELQATEGRVMVMHAEGRKADSKTKNTICGLSMDLDFVFASLDKIEGDSGIKAERKRLVTEFEGLIPRVDALEAFATKNEAWQSIR